MSMLGTPTLFRKVLNWSTVPRKAFWVANVTEVKRPLNPGYLASSLPPKMNLTDFVG